MRWLTKRIISLRHMKKCFIASTDILGRFGFKNADNIKYIKVVLKTFLLFTESDILDIGLRSIVWKIRIIYDYKLTCHSPVVTFCW